MIRFNFNLRKIAFALGLGAALNFSTTVEAGGLGGVAKSIGGGGGGGSIGKAFGGGSTPKLSNPLPAAGKQLQQTWNNNVGQPAQKAWNSETQHVKQQASGGHRRVESVGQQLGTHAPIKSAPQKFESVRKSVTETVRHNTNSVLAPVKELGKSAKSGLQSTAQTGRTIVDGGKKIVRSNVETQIQLGRTGVDAAVKVNKGMNDLGIAGAKHAAREASNFLPSVKKHVFDPKKKINDFIINDPKTDLSKVQKKKEKKPGRIIDEGTTYLPVDQKPSRTNAPNSTGEILTGVGVLVGTILNATNNGGAAQGTFSSDPFVAAGESAGSYFPADSSFVPAAGNVFETTQTPVETVTAAEEVATTIEIYNLTDAARTFSVEVDGQTEDVTIEGGETIELNASKVVASFLVRSQVRRYTLSGGQAYKFAAGNDGQLNLFAFDPATLVRE